MGKRSNFQRRPQDAYYTTDPRPVQVLAPHLAGIKSFAEPCAGGLDLMLQLRGLGLECRWMSDIMWTPSLDAFDLNFRGVVDAIITNPPWTREILHPMITHFCVQVQTWLLFDSDWAYNKESGPYLALCSDIVAVGRVKWMPGSKSVGVDNASWYRFDVHHKGPTRFWGRT